MCDLNAHFRTAEQAVIEDMPWGHLEWYVSAAIGNSDSMTIGLCVLNAAERNGTHLHPNCDEILRVISGNIENSWGGETQIMGPGDVIVIPRGVAHFARNLSDEPAHLSISFSSAYRKTVDLDGAH